MTRKVKWGWSPEDVDKLIRVYETKTQEEVMNLFPGRPWKNIWTKAHSFGLKRTNVHRNGKPMKYLIDLEEIDSEVKAYILGFISADGCLAKRVGNRTPALSIKLSKKDKRFLEDIRTIISPESKIRYSKRDDMFEFSVADKDLEKQLVKHGIVIRKTYNPMVPFTVPADLIRHWIRGYFDGDGCVTFGKLYDFPDCFIGAYTLPSGTNPILEFINDEYKKVYEHGCSVTLNQKGLSTLHYGGHTSIVFLSWIYNNSHHYMERKYSLVKKYLIDDIQSYTNNIRKKYWTPEEIEYLRANYKKTSYREIGKTLGRTETAVNAKAFELRKLSLL